MGQLEKFFQYNIQFSSTLLFFISQQKFQVESSEVQSAILSEDQHNQLKIAYNLIVDNKRFADATAMYRLVSISIDSLLRARSMAAWRKRLGEQL